MKNRIALITGGMGDIGTAICQEFFNRGAKVIAADRLDKDKALAWQAHSEGSARCRDQGNRTGNRPAP